jgi:hypothetical protein
MTSTLKINNRGSLMTFTNENGQEQCLGYLMNFNEHGIHEPNFGGLDVSKEEADIHNKLLDSAMLNGLDENCQIGQGGTFYFVGGKVTTWAGAVVAASASTKGRSITFARNGKVYRGILQKNADCFNFNRIR